MGKGYTHFSYCLATALFSLADFSSGVSLDGLSADCDVRRSGRCLACAHASGHAAPQMQRPNWLAGHAKPACRSDQRRAITASGRAFDRTGRPAGTRGRSVSADRQRASRGPCDGRCKRETAFAGPVFKFERADGCPPVVHQSENDGVSEATSSDLIVSAKPERREHVPLGILYMIGATIVFAASSAVSKWLVASYPIGEVLFTRTAVALVTCALFILPQTGLAVFRTQRLRHHVGRSLSQGCSQTFLLIAFSLMPLAGAIAINFSSPLFATLVSALLLKEAVGLARWAALLVGFCGVLIVAHPGAEAVQIGALFALANAVLYGSVTAAVRGMTATESAETLTLYQLTLLTALFTLMLPLGWVSPTPVDAAWIVFNGVSNAVGQYWWTRALHLAPASAVAPFYYLSLIWASILGFAVWGEVPTVSLVIGSAVVVASGLFLLWRENSARQAKLPANE